MLEVMGWWGGTWEKLSVLRSSLAASQKGRCEGAEGTGSGGKARGAAHPSMSPQVAARMTRTTTEQVAQLASQAESPHHVIEG